MTRLVVVALVALAGTASAHKPSDAHVQLAIAGDRVTGTAAIALRDLDGALDLDANGDGTITWREAQAAGPRIAAYATERIVLAGDDGTCKLAFGAGTLSDYSDGAYWSMPVTGACAGDHLRLTYAVLFDLDAQHRGIIAIRTPRGTSTTVVRDATPLALAVGDGGFAGGALAGIELVITSLAALACLLLLVAPAHRDRIATLRASIGAFVLGSAAITSIAAAGLVALPAHVVAIAGIGSVAIAAAGNVIRRDAARWDLAFELGLLHGMSASVALSSLAPQHRATIFGFVAGAALAQVAIAALLAAVLYAARRVITRRPVLWVSGASAVAAVVWAIVVA